MASHRRHLAVAAAVAQMCHSWARGWLQVLLARSWVPQLQGGWAQAQRPLRRTLKVISVVSSQDLTAEPCLQVGKKILVGCVRHVDSGVVNGPRAGKWKSG
jgi:hypothetical protein